MEGVNVWLDHEMQSMAAHGTAGYGKASFGGARTGLE